MKKTTNISIAQQLFHIDEDAFILLDDYLKSIKNHFSGQEDLDEIISDIEFRIAEHFNNQNKDIITKEITQTVINIMGTVDQFSDKEDLSKNKVLRKLYRDPDGCVIAGIASGLSYYFGLNKNLIRLIFVLSIFFGGFGIAIYIILWLVVPMANNSIQKLEMRGEAITFSGMSDFIREQYSKNENSLEQNAHGIFLKLGTLIKKIFGIFISSISFLGIILITIFASIGATKIPQEIFGDPIIGITANTFYYFPTIIFGFLAIILPAIVVFLWGIDIVWKKQILKKVPLIVFISIWFVSIILAIFCAVSLISKYVLIENDIRQNIKDEIVILD